MNKNNLIRFAQSFILLPFVIGTVPIGGVLKDNITQKNFQTVFMQKENIEAPSMIAFNQAKEQEALDLKAKADAIDSYFESYDMPLFGMGMKMVEEAKKNNLDWRLLPAIAIRESTGGKHDCKKVENNPFGWGSCKISFGSNEEAIEVIAKNLGGNNPNTEKHYAQKTLKEILQAENPPSVIPRYAEQVISIMDSIGEENLTATVEVEVNV